MTHSLKRLVTPLLCAACLSAAAQTYTAEPATVAWPFAGTVDEAQCQPADGFTITSFTAGEALPYVKAQSYAGVSYATFGPTTQASGPGETCALQFRIQAAAGLTLTPQRLTAKVRRFGTDGGKMDFSIRDAAGRETSLAKGIIPARNKAAADDKTSSDANYREAVDLAVPADFTAGQECTLVVYIYSLGTGKQAGLADVSLTGSLTGTVANVAKHTITIEASPAEGGTLVQTPAGEQFAEGTPLTLSAKKNFGFRFVNWTDQTGAEVSAEPDFVYTLNADTRLTAHFAPVATHSLEATALAPANSYQVELEPAPTIIGGRAMYEDGTIVTARATSNRIITFTSWSDGQTSPEIKLTMDADKQIAANFSAVDFIAGWDFHRRGSAGRAADFYAADNDADALVLRNADGDTQGWLDKSAEGGASYEGRWGGVNWRTDGLGQWYWQTAVNAEAFTALTVCSSMVYNYNSYTRFLLQYSLDGTQWTTADTIRLEAPKRWKDTEISLPADCDNKPNVLIRWMPDTDSAVDGTKSANDGSGIADIYILATARPIDDGTAPQLVSTLPAAGADNAGINGRVILTFDEKVKAEPGTTATLDGQKLTPTVAGRTVIFDYKNLQYATDYTFTLPPAVIGDLTGNMYAPEISIPFTTRTRPAVAKAMYDFIIPDDGNLRDACAAANRRADKQTRYRVFIRKGDYQVPADETQTITGSDGVAYPSPVTTLAAPNVSLIGEDRDMTVLSNTIPDVYPEGQYGPASPIEGLHNSETLFLDRQATGTYLQDLTLRSSMPDARGRNSAFEDYSDRTACKNIALVGYQDTYYSGSGRYYFEGGRLRGRTDFLCGKGDAYFQGCDLIMCEQGGYIAVPSQPGKYGYVFRECTIKAEKDGVDGTFSLGRPWGQGTPTARFIDTRMEAKPTAAGWGEMSGGWPARFAEYNSTTATGTIVDLSNRKRTFGDGHPNNPELTRAEADSLTVEAVMGQTDGWDPAALTEQAAAPQKVEITSAGLITWEPNDYALLWAVCKDGTAVAFTTEPLYQADDPQADWTVRAANEMGGLGEPARAALTTAVSAPQSAAGPARYYDLSGRPATASHRGPAIKVEAGKAAKMVKR